jgi:outer membrane protein OmpA-like peptidoglycan-associated protein
VHVVLWTPAKTTEGMRFSILYEFNKSRAIKMYERYLIDVVTPKIPINGTVIIHGHTDITGSEVNNQSLSLARANDVKGIIQKGLSKTGRKDVKFEVYGYGEDQKLAPFENKYPEERFYNRTVIIDISLQK